MKKILISKQMVKNIQLHTFMLSLVLLVSAAAQAQVGRWGLNNNATDASGNSITGTLINSPTYTTDSKEGSYSLSVNGTNQYIDLGNPSVLPSGSSARTISAWAKASDVTGSRIIASFGTAGSSQAMNIGLNGTSLVGGAFGNTLTVTSFWATGVWHHICLTYDGTTAKLYADGALVSSSARAWSLVLSKAYIGCNVSTNNFWSGNIDDVRIYASALSATEVQALATVPPIAPSALTATTASSTSINLAWTDNSSDETGFQIERSLTSGSGYSLITTTAANAVSYSDASLTAGTTYYYRIRSTNAGGTSAYTSEATASTTGSGPTAPSALTATTTSSTAINLTWTDNSTNETGFQIERSLTSGSGFSLITTTASNAVSYSDASLTAGTTYYYRIRAANGTGTSAYTSEVNATTTASPPAAPSALTATAASSTTINLTWTDNASNETGFQIERSLTSGSGFSLVTTTAANAVSYSDASLTASTTYYYRIRATNGGGTSAYTSEANATTTVSAPTAPSGLTATAASATTINLAWTDNASNETGFQIERSLTSGSGFTLITTTAANAVSYSDGSLTAGTTYYYRIRATNGGGTSAYTSEANATTTVSAPTAPSALTAMAASTTTINLTWTDNASNETGFQVERSLTSGSGFSLITTTAANAVSYSDASLSAGTTYYYRIRATNAGGNSAYTSEANATTNSASAGLVGWWKLNNDASDASGNSINGTLISSPTFTSDSKEGSYSMTVNGTSQYIDLGNPSLLPSGTAARTISAWAKTTTVTGSKSILAFGTASTSQAMNIGMNGTSLIGGAFANNLTVTNFWATGVWHHICMTYDGTTAKLYADGALVSSASRPWSLVQSKAYIGRNVNNSDYWSGSIDDVRIYSTALTATDVQALAAQTPAPSAPTTLTATAASSTSVNLTWTDNSSNETGFQIERSLTSGSGFSLVTTTAANAVSYSDANLTANTTYYYRIRAANSGGNSSYTSEATVTTPVTAPTAPSALSATAASTSSINLTWTDNSTNESGFQIERSLTTGSGYTLVFTTAADAVSYSDGSLSAGTTYYYRIRATNAGGTSAYTAEVNATTISNGPTAPSGLAATAASTSSINLTWTDNSSNEGGFEIERSLTTGSGFALVTTVAANSVSYTDVSLSASTKYYYRIRAVLSGTYSTYTSEVNATTLSTPPAAPTALAATAASSTSINLTWTDNSSNETGFQIERSLTSGSGFTLINTTAVNATTYSDASLTAGTPYYYRIRAINSGGNSTYSTEANATTLSLPAAPGSLTATAASTSSINLTWADNSSNETGFQIERSLTSASGYSLVTTTAANVTSYTNTGLTANTLYYYRVRATNAAGTSAYTATASATTLVNEGSVPDALELQALHDICQYNKPNDYWPAIDTWPANANNIFFATLNGVTVQNGDVTKINLEYHDLEGTIQPSIGNLAMLKELWLDANSHLGGAIPESMAHLNNLEQLRLNDCNFTSIPNFSQITNASNLVVYVDGNYIAISSLEPNYVAGLVGTYVFKEFYDTPQLLYSNVATKMVTITAGSTTIENALADGAETEYQWYEENGTEITDQTNPTLTLDSVDQSFVGRKYICSMSNNRIGFNADITFQVESVIAPVLPVAPTSLTASAASSSSINLSWADNSTNETGFQIERSLTTNTGFALIATAASNAISYTDVNLVAATKYYYRIRAINPGGNSAYTSEANATTVVAPPAMPDSLVAVAISTTAINLSWNDNALTETGFQIERSLTSGSGFSLLTTTGANILTYSDAGLTSGTRYYYRIRAINAGGNSAYTSEASASTQVSPPVAPLNLTVAASSSVSITLNWTDNSTNETGFQVERSLNASSGFVPITTTIANAVSYADLNLSSGVTYYYRIRATNSGGNSDYTSVVNSKTKIGAPTSLLVTTLSTTSLKLLWTDNTSGETGFQVERSTLPTSGFSLLATTPANGKTYTDTGLGIGTVYYYRVRAINSTENSAYSNIASSATLADEGLVPDAVELAVLHDLAVSLELEGKNWPSTSSWPTQASSDIFGGWDGITVENKDIVALNISDFGDFAYIPQSITNLTQLTDLNASSLGLVDFNVANFSNLQRLDISDNLIGKRHMVADMTGLQFLNISNNKDYLTGPQVDMVEFDVSKLQDLEFLSCTGNGIYQLKGFSNLTKLKHLELTDNNLKDLPGVSDLPLLDYVNVSYNRLDFGDLEAFYSGVNTPKITFFEFSNQYLGFIEYAIAPGVQTIRNDRKGGLHTQYQWEQGGNELPDKTMADLVINITEELFLNGQDFICKMSNDWFPGTTLYSSTNFLDLGDTDSHSVAWTDFKSTKLDDNYGVIKTKTSVADDASAVSSNILEGSNDGWVQFNIADYDESLLIESLIVSTIGLARPNSVAAESSIDYGFKFDNSGFVSIIEGGVIKSSVGSYLSSSSYRIERVGNTITYSWNGGSYTSTTDPELLLIIDASIRKGHLPFVTTSFSRSPQTYYAIGDGEWTDSPIWSLTDGGEPVALYPGNSDTAVIKGHNVLINSGIYSAGVNIVVNNDKTSLRIDGSNALLNVNGEVTIQGENNPNTVKSLIVRNDGAIAVQAP